MLDKLGIAWVVKMGATPRSDSGGSVKECAEASRVRGVDVGCSCLQADREGRGVTKERGDRDVVLLLAGSTICERS